MEHLAQNVRNRSRSVQKGLPGAPDGSFGLKKCWGPFPSVLTSIFEDIAEKRLLSVVGLVWSTLEVSISELKRS